LYEPLEELFQHANRVIEGLQDAREGLLVAGEEVGALDDNITALKEFITEMGGLHPEFRKQGHRD